VGVDQTHHCRRGLLGAQADAGAELRQRSTGTIEIERHPTVVETLGVETAEHQIRVRDGGWCRPRR
jgi:hypothetical protein